MTIQLTNSYHSHLVSPRELKKTVDKVAKAVNKIHAKGKLSHILCTGISGQAISWPVSYVTKIPVVIVRKPRESTHGNEVEGEGVLKNFIIIDDFISEGTTVKRLIKVMKAQESITPLPRKYKLACKGIILYNSCGAQAGDEFMGIPIIPV